MGKRQRIYKMKQTDIKRLEKVVVLYQKIEDILDKTTDSIEKQPTEYFRSSIGGECSTYRMVADWLTDAARTRKFIEGKIRAFKAMSD